MNEGGQFLAEAPLCQTPTYSAPEMQLSHGAIGSREGDIYTLAASALCLFYRKEVRRFFAPDACRRRNSTTVNHIFSNLHLQPSFDSC
jgi:hypothetical protein